MAEPVRVLRTAAEARAWRASAGRVGLVPTMGALHAGHVSLVERAVRESDAAIVSIFVNPTQFGPNDDLSTYPRPEERDLQLLEHAGAAAAFVPSVDEIYPPGDATRVRPGPVADPLEGVARPGHFVGVATVVVKLWSIIQPEVSFFGQKDFQQLRVLQTVARDLRLGVRVVGCPIVRDGDGMALSSRNAYLTPDERVRALALSRALFAARQRWEHNTRDPEVLRQSLRERLVDPGLSLEYVSVADPITLVELGAPAERTVVSLAARVGKARLIDNVLLGMDVSELS